MAATPEVKAKNQIKKALAEVLKERQLPAKIYWNAGTGFGVARLDCDGVIAGHPFSIEVKRFDGQGKLTARQVADIRDYTEAGAFSMVVDSEETLQRFLWWVRYLTPRQPELPHLLQPLMG